MFFDFLKSITTQAEIYGGRTHNLSGHYGGIWLPTPPKIPIYGCRMGLSVRAPHHNAHHNYRSYMVGLPTIRFIMEGTALIIMVPVPTIILHLRFIMEGNISIIMVPVPTLITYGWHRTQNDGRCTHHKKHSIMVCTDTIIMGATPLIKNHMLLGWAQLPILWLYCPS